jgi:ADP-ribosylglycohydrolase/fructose-1,6-bisphosphatase/inositol monophosphatase family enzyme
MTDVTSGMQLTPAHLAAVLSAVEAEGERLRAEFLRPEGPRGAGHKAPIDTEIEERLRAALQAVIPCDFVGEETGATPGTLSGWRWLVDPHDGTSDFLKGHRGSAISVALLRGREPVLGVVHSPNSPGRGHDTISWAEGCGPVRRNGAPATRLNGASPTRRLDDGRRLAAGEIVWVSASAAQRPVVFARGVAPARFIALPSIAHRLARIAAGDGVAAISVHPVAEYDIAAGAALVRGAGGVLLDASGAEIRFSDNGLGRVSGCFAGAPGAAAQLARFDLSAVEREKKLPLRTPLGFPKLADDTRLARAQGCLMGQVAGDSLGSLVEFKSRDTIARRYPHGVRDLADGGTWNTIAGQPTDDSELALALARSLVRERRFDPAAVRQAYRDWMASRPFDIGATTRAGILGHPDVDSQANGSLMRVSPIGIWAAGDPALAARLAREDSALTHPNPVCQEACAGFAAALAAGIAGADRPAMLDAALRHAAGPARDALERGARGERVADVDTNQGWVLIALQNAFFQLLHAQGAEEGLIATASAGGDTDTNAAIAGALLGAACGIPALPDRWINAVLACRPLAEVQAMRPRPMACWPDDVLELAESLVGRTP